MFRSVVMLLTALVMLPMFSYAQIPGDMNCSGSFDGLDITFLVANLFFWGPPGPFMDTTICTWENGDINGDGINHTIADWWQIFFSNQSIPNNPPMPAGLDTIYISDFYASPGDTIVVPVRMKIAEWFTGALFHLSFDSTRIQILSYSENQFIDSLFGGNFYIDQGRFLAFQLSNTHPQAPGSYEFGELQIEIAEDVSPGTDITLHLVPGTYYPCGFANYSIPTYLIQPILEDGIIHVITTGMNETANPVLPEIYLTNYPNPFNASTKIEFELQADSFVELAIYNILGREIEKPLFAFMPPGRHAITWDGSSYPTGIYFYRLETAEGSYTRRMTLLK